MTAIDKLKALPNPFLGVHLPRKETREEKRIRMLTPYSQDAVDKAIAASNRSGRRIGGKEAKAIHRVLKGRHGG